MTATAKDLRFYSKELIETVSRGEEVIITYRGKPSAKLISYKEHEEPQEEQELFGLWNDHDEIENVGEYVRSLRKGRF